MREVPLTHDRQSRYADQHEVAGSDFVLGGPLGGPRKTALSARPHI
jgi:hypothetical protein